LVVAVSVVEVGKFEFVFVDVLDELQLITIAVTAAIIINFIDISFY